MSRTESHARSFPSTAEADAGTAGTRDPRISMRGVFWRRYLHLAGKYCPVYLEPAVNFFFSLVFFLCAPRMRKQIGDHLNCLFPEASRIVISWRTFLITWNFAWSLCDTARFQEVECEFDWEFENKKDFDSLMDEKNGAIILTAHMGNYDLGSFLFAKKLKVPLTIVRAMEEDPRTQDFVHTRKSSSQSGIIQTSYSLSSETVSLDLLKKLRASELVAIQGDRILGGLAPISIRIFNKVADIPVGPFALALASGCPIYPLFVVRTGYRKYRAITGQPIMVTRTATDKSNDLALAAEKWVDALESNIRNHWQQWHPFADLVWRDIDS